MVGEDGNWVDYLQFLPQATIRTGWVQGIGVKGSEWGNIVQAKVSIFPTEAWHFVFLFCQLVGHEHILLCRRDFFKVLFGPV